MNHWSKKTSRRQLYWERSDGAYVWYDNKTPYPNLLNPNARFWAAYGPNERYLRKEKRRTWMHIPRRWKTAEAAIKALDREVPIRRE